MPVNRPPSTHQTINRLNDDTTRPQPRFTANSDGLHAPNYLLLGHTAKSGLTNTCLSFLGLSQSRVELGVYKLDDTL
jgi:hypothetical protein